MDPSHLIRQIEDGFDKMEQDIWIHLDGPMWTHPDAIFPNISTVYTIVLYEYSYSECS